MKKFFALSLAVLSVTTLAVAAPDAVKELNEQILKILAPFNNATTKTNLAFRNISTNAERALSLAMTGHYQKLGSKNVFNVDIDSFSYEYGNGTSPTTKLSGSIGLDLTKVVPQEELNRFVPGLEKLLAETAKDMLKEYGEAVTAEVQVTDKQQDAAGNFTSIKASATFAIDLSKLPGNVKAEEVAFTKAQVAVAVGVTTGLGLDITVVSNPGYKGFRPDETGLKEYLDRLLANDPELIKSFGSIAKWLDEMATGVVEMAAPRR